MDILRNEIMLVLKKIRICKIVYIIVNILFVITCVSIILILISHNTIPDFLKIITILSVVLIIFLVMSNIIFYKLIKYDKLLEKLCKKLFEQ